MKKQKAWYPKVYLDEIPQFDAVVHSWLTDLNFDCHDVDIGLIEKIDCRSRDGFSAASHNHGGYERSGYTLLACAGGSGYSYGMGDAIGNAYNEGLDMALEQFIADHTEELKGVPEKDRNYNGLYDLKLSKLAEKLGEYEFESNEEAVWLGVRVMYEGVNAETKIHTLCIHVGGNISEYYGPFGKGSKDIAMYEITFKNVTQLKAKLKKIKKKVEEAF